MKVGLIMDNPYNFKPVNIQESQSFLDVVMEEASPAELIYENGNGLEGFYNPCWQIFIAGETAFRLFLCGGSLIGHDSKVGYYKIRFK